MALYKSKDNNLYLDCTCGCDNSLKFEINKWVDGDNISIYLYNGSVYRFSEWIRRLWCAITNKNYYRTDIVLSKEDWKEFYDYVLEVGYSINGEK